MPRRLGLGRRHAEVLAEQGVRDCGFADVRRAHDADEAGAEAGLGASAAVASSSAGCATPASSMEAAAASAASAVAAGAPSASSILSISTAFVPLTGRPSARHWSLRSGTRSSASASASGAATVHSGRARASASHAWRRVPGAAAQHEEQGEACNQRRLVGCCVERQMDASSAFARFNAAILLLIASGL